MRPGECWLKGRTARGHTVEIPRDPYLAPSTREVYIDGDLVLVDSVARYRGCRGTVVKTRRGTIAVPATFGGCPDRAPTLDGMVLEPC